MNRWWIAAACLCALPTLGVTVEPNHAIVPAFERFGATDHVKSADWGRLLLGELNCTSCHAADDGVAKKQAPILDQIGSRVKVGYLRKYLDDPHAVKPGTTMPQPLTGDPKRSEKIEALVHFLASTGTVKQERPDLKGIVLGGDHYRKLGCVACHGSRDAAGKQMTTTPSTMPLGDLRIKYSIASLTSFLENPLHTRPAGRMPRIANAKEAKELANYLLQGLHVDLTTARGASKFSYFEGDWERLPDFTKLKPALTGTAGAFDVSIARRGSNYAIRFEGFFKAEKDGDYRFFLHSDDGSNLYVNGKLVVDNDGIHPPKGASGMTTLTKGVHKVTVDFFQGGGGAELDVQIKGPSMTQRSLGDMVAATEAALDAQPEKPKVKTPDDIDIKPELVAQGRTVFQSGCASCHQLNEGKGNLASQMKAKPLAQLKPEGGCLSPTPIAARPRYALSDAQRNALQAALKTPAKPSADAVGMIHRTMAQFNCYACHERNKLGGPEEALNTTFLTTQPEMGDEGRLPPPLDGVGNKLNSDYFKQLLDKGADDRPYMHTRMPGFGSANVGHLVPAFAEADKLAAMPEVTFGTTEGKVKAAGRYLVGSQALSCFKCHTFAGQKAQGVQGIDMTILTKRLNRDWFYRYLIDPQKVRPGTRMPASWPEGQTFYPKLLDGKIDAQIDSIWVYLKDGTSAQPPVGLGKQSIPLVPTTSAIVYRNFIQGAGTRAIGVGYPEKLNLAFDANEMRLAMIWQGAFIDAARHWTDRGVGFEGPLGDNVHKLHGGPPLAVLEKPDSPWPSKPAKELGYQFTGYRLSSDDRPTFLYTFGDVAIQDFPNPSDSKEPTLRRTLTMSGVKPGQGIYFRAALGKKIERDDKGWYRVDGVRLRVNAAGTVRKAGEQFELIVPLIGGTTVLELEYLW